MMKKMGWVWAGTFILAMVYLAVLWNCLPERIASHFDFNWRPNGYATKESFLTVFMTISVAVNLLFLVMGFITTRLPKELVNIPNKEFWLSTPERTAELDNRLGIIPCSIGAFVNLVLCMTQQMVYQANVTDPLFRLPAMILFPGFLIGGLLLLVLILWLGFAPPKE
jgi:uncharacterized membrane protein